MKIPHPDRVRRSDVLFIVLIVASLIITTIYYREGDTGPLRRARMAVQVITAPVAAAGDWLFTPVRATSRWLSGFGMNRAEVQVLREQNAELRTRVAELEEARLENERLRRLVTFAEAYDVDAIGARVIGRPTNAWESTLLIDKGSEDGVRPGMPVVAPEGLLGQTVEVTGRTAKVRLITDQRSGVAALLQPSRAEGILRGSIEGDLSLEYVSLEVTVTVGDVVLTSGLGGVYPKGLLIGEVSSYSRETNDLYPRIRVRPSARFSGIEEVIVLTGTSSESSTGGGE